VANGGCAGCSVLVVTDHPADEFAEGMRMHHESLWPIIGSDLPSEIFRRIDGTYAVLGEPESWSDATQRRVGFLLHVSDGLEAAYYHRDRIEAIEREIVATIRAKFTPGPHGQTFSSRTPKIGHEWIAYLNASRRTLEYLARAVSECFVRNTSKIKSLANAVDDAKPTDLAAEVARECANVERRFPHLLSETRGTSHRDRTAHHAPLEPAWLLVVFLDGKIGVELQAGDTAHLEELKTLDIKRMARDEPRLAQALDVELADLTEFCVNLMSLATQAEARRIAEGAA
jgi:hypothetical protein